MAVEYKDGKIVLRDTHGVQMSLPRFFQLALLNTDSTHGVQPSSGLYRNDSTEFHGAWDMGTNGTTDVIARTPVEGSVVYVGGASGFGPNLVIVKEEAYERYHYFGHLASANIVQGSAVRQGDLIGIIGGYGGTAGNWNPNAYATHLHYEIMTKNIMVSGGYTTDKEFVLDPADVYDNSTLPNGWLFGYDPITQPQTYAAKVYNWDYIQLDKDATDFGPSGGEPAPEPFFPKTQCYDIAHPQVINGSLHTCISAIANSGAGGIILQVGSIRDTGFRAETAFSPSEAIKEVLDSGLGLGIYFYNYASYSSDMTGAFEDALEYLQSCGATKEKVNMGVWIDTEQGSSWDPQPSSDKNVNYAYVERFLNVFTDGGYPLVGVYSSAGTFSIYPTSKIGDKPIWAAYIPFTFEEASRNTLERYLPSDTYTNVYIFQHSWTGRVPGFSGDLDCDKVLKELPTIGGGGGGGTYTQVIDVTVDIVPPKRIYFSPNPGTISTSTSLLSDRTATIAITTDAEDAHLYYTTDGSSPYQYYIDNGTTQYTIAANAILYVAPITITKDTHIRVVAVPRDVGEFERPLAKGSGTYLFAYQDIIHDWSTEQESYATGNDTTSFFEENRQAFLRIHDRETDEEILYNRAYKHDTQIVEDNATDNASSTSSTEPQSEEF